MVMLAAEGNKLNNTTMIFLTSDESTRLAELRNGGEPEMRETVRKLVQKNRYQEAAHCYAALAMYHDQDVDPALRSARSYQRLDDRVDAGRWFLEAARRYALQNYPVQAMAALRLYREMMPGEHAGPREIFRICRGQDGMRSDFVDMLGERDRAGYRMRGEDLFSGMDDELFDRMLDRMKYRAVQKGEQLLHMGDSANSLFLLTSGSMHCFMDIGGKRRQLGSVQPGEIYGEISYFTGGRRTAEVVADSDCEVLELPYEALDDFSKHAPELHDRIEQLYRRRMLDKQLAIAPVFGELPMEQRKRLAAGMMPLELKAGVTLFNENDTNGDVYMLRQGRISLNVMVDGEEQQLKMVETGALVGEMAVMVGWRTATARLMTDCKLMCLDGKLYGELYDDSPELRAALERMKDSQFDETRRFMQAAGEEEEDYGERLLRSIWGV